MTTRPNAGREAGFILFVALIVLVAMSLAAVGLVRSIDASTGIAGNMAFKQSTINISDIGIEHAFDELPTIMGTSLEANFPGGCSANCTYYPTLRESDNRGLPTRKQFDPASPTGGVAIDWPSVAAAPGSPAGYVVRYVIDRLCLGPAPVTDITARCYNETPAEGGSRKAGAPVFTSAGTVYYRVTIRVEGPRNTLTYTQVVFNR